MPRVREGPIISSDFSASCSATWENVGYMMVLGVSVVDRVAIWELWQDLTDKSQHDDL